MEDDVPRMPDHLGSDLDELLTKRSQRPLLYRLGQLPDTAGNYQGCKPKQRAEDEPDYPRDHDKKAPSSSRRICLP